MVVRIVFPVLLFVSTIESLFPRLCCCFTDTFYWLSRVHEENELKRKNWKIIRVRKEQGTLPKLACITFHHHGAGLPPCLYRLTSVCKKKGFLGASELHPRLPGFELRVCVCVCVCLQAQQRRMKETTCCWSTWTSSGGSLTCGATCSRISSTTSPRCWSRWSSTRNLPWWGFPAEASACTNAHQQLSQLSQLSAPCFLSSPSSCVGSF